MKLDWESIGIRLDFDWYLIGIQLVSDWMSIAIWLWANFYQIGCWLLSNCHSIGSPIVINWIKFISGVAPRSFPFIKGNDRGAIKKMKLYYRDRVPWNDPLHDWHLIGSNCHWIGSPIVINWNEFISEVAPRSFPFIKGNDRGAVF